MERERSQGNSWRLQGDGHFGRTRSPQHNNQLTEQTSTNTRIPPNVAHVTDLTYLVFPCPLVYGPLTCTHIAHIHTHTHT